MKFEHVLMLIAAAVCLVELTEHQALDTIADKCKTNGVFADNNGTLWNCRGVGGFIDERREVTVSPKIDFKMDD